ncbi:mRNA-degrading endonuclease HigB of HigAB toxin-antitoxin module [Pedobacter sp. UYP30]
MEKPNQIKKEYPSANLLIDNKVVFKIKGNHYRLIVKLITNINWFLSNLLELMPSMIKLMPKQFKNGH